MCGSDLAIQPDSAPRTEGPLPPGALHPCLRGDRDSLAGWNPRRGIRCSASLSKVLVGEYEYMWIRYLMLLPGGRRLALGSRRRCELSKVSSIHPVMRVVDTTLTTRPHRKNSLKQLPQRTRERLFACPYAGLRLSTSTATSSSSLPPARSFAPATSFSASESESAGKSLRTSPAMASGEASSQPLISYRPSV